MHHRLSRPAFVPVLLALMVGCQGRVSAPDGAESGDSAIAGAGGGEPGPLLGIPEGQTCAANVDPGRTVLRRLTADEYDNTLRDLLGDASTPGRGFPADDQSAADQLILTGLLFEKYETAASTVVDAVWQREMTSSKTEPHLLICKPSGGDTACARRLIKTFARKAFRRPVDDAELAAYYKLAESGDIVAGTKAAVRALLTSPFFLFRIEVPSAGDASKVSPLSPHELATRLSYALWASTPDARLDQLADSGTLAKSDVLQTEIRRMLADPKAEALATSFSARWLGFREVLSSRPDAQMFPEVTPALLASMALETERFMRELIVQDRPLIDLLDAEFTFADAGLAQHYGLPTAGLSEQALTRVDVAGQARRGILGHGSFLVSTSPPTRTSPVKRGKWVAGRLLCSAPPPPPPGEDIPSEAATQAKTERERLAIHRVKPQCAGCHELIDPIGLGLDRYDPVGKFRDEVKGQPIDDSGVMPDGTAFKGPNELATLLRKDRRFAECTAHHLLTWTLGRVPQGADGCLVGEVADTLVKPGAGISELWSTIVKSRAFTHRRGDVQGETP